MRKLVSLSVIVCLPFIIFFSSIPLCAEEAQWKLIHKDARGNATSIDTETLSRPSQDTVRVQMKYVTNKGKTTMFFLDEIDCSKNMIKRLSVQMHNPTCLGEGEPFYQNSFEGKWDTLSEGLEIQLRDAVCK